MTKKDAIQTLESIARNTASYLQNLGYEVNVKTSEDKLVIGIRPTEEYLPELYFHSEDVFDMEQLNGQWTLQTVSYGTLVGEELKKYIDGITNGANAVHALNCFQETKEAFLEKAE